ncbi:MAG: helix-turn-helix domain-containing protein, partial [Vicinamibacteria bacterium]
PREEHPREPADAREERREQPFLQVGMTVEEATRALMLRTLETTSYNKTRTAQILGVSAKTVYNKLKEWSAAGDVEAQHADALSRGHGREPVSRNAASTGRLVSIDVARKRRFA